MLQNAIGCTVMCSFSPKLLGLYDCHCLGWLDFRRVFDLTDALGSFHQSLRSRIVNITQTDDSTWNHINPRRGHD